MSRLVPRCYKCLGWKNSSLGIPAKYLVLFSKYLQAEIEPDNEAHLSDKKEPSARGVVCYVESFFSLLQGEIGVFS